MEGGKVGGTEEVGASSLTRILSAPLQKRQPELWFSNLQLEKKKHTVERVP